MKMLILLATTLLVGCANLDMMTDEEREDYLMAREDVLYERQEALIEAQLAHAQKVEACRASGGVIFIPGQSATRIRHGRKESRSDYLLARCAKL